MEIRAFIISIGAFLVSAFTFIRTWYVNKFKIDVKLINTYETPHQGFYAKLQIENKSATQVSVTGLSIDDIQYNSSGKLAVQGSEINPPIYNQVIPVDIGGYNAKKFYVHFRTNKRLYDFDDVVNLIVYTSRGNHEIKVNIKDVEKPLDKIRD